MATSKSALSHLERTAAEPRDTSLRNVTISRIEEATPKVRLFQLQPHRHELPISFQPGQWLDVYVPGIPKAGGFTITSTPSSPHLELAIQESSQNPPAAWLWQDEDRVLGQELQVRVGGSFVWPPRGAFKKVVFIAGGVGINPLISMVSAIAEMKKEGTKLGFVVEFLYSTKLPEPRGSGASLTTEQSSESSPGLPGILFLSRLLSIGKRLSEELKLRLFLTPYHTESHKLQHDDEVLRSVRLQDEGVPMLQRRITEQDILLALGPVEARPHTVCYICGVPGMTDEFVEKVLKAEGMGKSNVLFEKWW